jgi:hypothetical protein
MPQPSLLAATASGLESLGLGGLSQPSSSQQLMMAEAPSVPAASDYTAGTAFALVPAALQVVL